MLKTLSELAPEHYGEYLDEIVVHELAHLVQGKLNPNQEIGHDDFFVSLLRLMGYNPVIPEIVCVEGDYLRGTNISVDRFVELAKGE